VFSLAHELHAVASLLLGTIERLIRQLQRTTGTALARGLDQGKSYADRHSGVGSRIQVLDLQLTYRPADMLCNILRLRGIDVVENRAKFFTAIAGQYIQGTAREALKALGNLAQRLITGQMPVAVVVSFEMIDIDQQDRHGLVIALRLQPKSFEILIEDAPVAGAHITAPVSRNAAERAMKDSGRP